MEIKIGLQTGGRKLIIEVPQNMETERNMELQQEKKQMIFGLLK